MASGVRQDAHGGRFRGVASRPGMASADTGRGSVCLLGFGAWACCVGVIGSAASAAVMVWPPGLSFAASAVGLSRYGGGLAFCRDSVLSGR